MSLMKVSPNRSPSTAKTETKFVDPLSFQTIKQGDRVSVQTEGGAIVTFRVLNVQEDDRILLERPSAKKQTTASANSILINHKMVFGKFGLQPGERIQVKFKSGGTESWLVQLVVNDDLLVITRPGRKKLGLFETLKFLWKAKGL